jgi:hypothetical protein
MNEKRTDCFDRSRYNYSYLNRWCQPDSNIPDNFNPLDWDRYSYSYGNPVKYIDPSGHKPCEGRDAGVFGGCTPASDPFTKNEIIDALKYENNFLRGLDLDKLPQDQLLDAYNNLSNLHDTLLNLSQNVRKDINSPETWSTIATGLDTIAWFIDLIDAGVVTYGGIFGAGITSPAILAGEPEIPVSTGLVGIIAAEFYIQPPMKVANFYATLAMLATIRSNYLKGNVSQPSTYNSSALTIIGWINPEAYTSLILQSVSVGNDLSWWSFPFK